MTRSTIRLAQICGAALAAGILTAALARSTRAGLASTAQLLTIVAAASAVASAAWHGTAAAIERREEMLRTRRHRRAVRPEGEMERRPADPAAPADPPPHGLTRAEAEELREELGDRFAPHLAPAEPVWPDPYPAPAGAEWSAATPARPGDHDDLYAHPGHRTT